MLKRLRYLLAVLALVTLAVPCAHAQDKSQDKSQDKNRDPKVVVELEKRPPTSDSNAKEPAGADGSTRLSPAEPFGKACSAVGAAKDGYRNLDRPLTISELFGAPITLVTIRRLGNGQEKLDREELRKRIVAVLLTETAEVSRYADWDEWVPLGIVATIQFPDRTKSVLEESGGHVCFSDYAGTVWWLRIPPASTH